jgi:triosephosphate isomerase
MPRRRKVAVAEEPENIPPVEKKPKSSSKEKPSKKVKHEPVWLIGDGKTVANLILSIQKSDCNSSKIIVELTKLYKQVN